MRTAVFTMVYNESVFLPLWISYYSKQFGKENLFVIDVGSTDGSTSNLKNCITFPRSALDDERRTAFVRSFQASLLSYYDVVIFTDTDEFLVADPDRYSDLLEFISRKEEKIIAGVGLNVLHITDAEQSLVSDVPILRQRRFVQFDSLYCKPLIGRGPIQWTPGFHTCQGKFVICTDLYLFHLKSFDFQIFMNEIKIKKLAGMSEEAKNKGLGAQLHMASLELMDLYFEKKSPDILSISDESFDFSNDLSKFVQNGFQGLGKSRGALGRIPERFLEAIPALAG